MKTSNATCEKKRETEGRRIRVFVTRVISSLETRDKNFIDPLLLPIIPSSVIPESGNRIERDNWSDFPPMGYSIRQRVSSAILLNSIIDCKPASKRLKRERKRGDYRTLVGKGGGIFFERERASS